MKIKKGKHYSLYVEDKELQAKLDVLGMLGLRSKFIEKALLESRYFTDEYFKKEVVPFAEKHREEILTKLNSSSISLSEQKETLKDKEDEQQNYEILHQRGRAEEIDLKEQQETTQQIQEKSYKKTIIKSIENLL